MPPPRPGAELPLIVLFVTVAKAGALKNVPLRMPPPFEAWPAELPLIVLFMTVRKPVKFDTPGPELSLIMLSAIVMEPAPPAGWLDGGGPPWGPSLTSPPDELLLTVQLLTVVMPK